MRYRSRRGLAHRVVSQVGAGDEGDAAVDGFGGQAYRFTEGRKKLPGLVEFSCFGIALHHTRFLGSLSISYSRSFSRMTFISSYDSIG